MVKNLFSGTLDIVTIPSDVQDEFLDLKNNYAAKDVYEKKTLTVFWCSMHQSYPKVSEIALFPFFNYLFMRIWFLHLLHLKSESRNRLNVDPDMRCALSVTTSDQSPV